MKLKTKLVLLVFFILAVSMGACAVFSIARLKEYSLPAGGDPGGL